MAGVGGPQVLADSKTQVDPGGCREPKYFPGKTRTLSRHLKASFSTLANLKILQRLD